jgi:hypothetical protein
MGKQQWRKVLHKRWSKDFVLGDRSSHRLSLKTIIFDRAAFSRKDAGLPPPTHESVNGPSMLASGIG